MSDTHSSLTKRGQDLLEMLRVSMPGLNASIEVYRKAEDSDLASSCASDTLTRVLNCPVHLHEAKGWPDIKAMAEKQLEAVNKDKTAALNPITAFWTSSKDHPLTHYQTGSPASATTVDDRTAALNHYFYEADYLGDAHNALFQTLKRAERNIVADWAKDRVSKNGQDVKLEDYDSAYARCLPITQSAGMGKSRLLRELGKVTDKHGQERVFVLSLCLRPGSDARAPEADVGVRDFFNGKLDEREEELGLGFERERWDIKVHSFFHALWEGASALLEQQDGAEAWQDLCDPNTTYKRQLRAGFFSKVTKCATLMTQELVGPSEQTGIEHYRKAITESALRAVTAARTFREKLSHGDWVVLALDDAYGICPGNLTPSRDQASLEEFTQECLDTIIRLFSNTHPTQRFKPREILPPRPERFWIAVTGTDPTFLNLNGAATGRNWDAVGETFLKPIPPCYLVNLNLPLKEPPFASQLLSWTPLETSTEHAIAQTGRPLWQSLLPIDSSASIPRSGHKHAGGEHTYATPEFVLEQLLGPLQVTKARDISLEQSELLLSHRLALDPKSYHYRTLEDAPIAIHKKRVRHHLGVAVATSEDGREVVLQVPPEPLITKAASGLFRTDGKDTHGNYIVWPAGTNIWKEVWISFRNLTENKHKHHPQLFSMEHIDAPEDITSQAILCMAHDLATRPNGQGSTPGTAYLGRAAFVHVKAFMQQYTFATLPAEMLADLTDNAWMNFERFSRPHDSTLTRHDLVNAWFMRSAIAAVPGSRNYDYVIPIYCGALDAAFHPRYLTWMEVRIKKRGTRPASAIRSQTLEYGDFLSDDEATKASIYSEFTPAVPSIVLQLDMTASPKRSKDAKTVLVASNAPATRGKKCWYVEFPTFDQRNHPVLQKLWPEGDFHALRPNAKNLATCWTHEMQEHGVKSLIERPISG